MKVLWFCLTSCSAVELEDKSILGGGWLISLEKELRKNKNVQLSISFFSDKNEQPFDYCGVKYYPVKKTKVDRVSIRLFPRVMHKFDKKFVEVIKHVKPDLIHIHGSEFEFTNIIGLTDVPVVLSMQSILSPYEEKYFSGISRPELFRYGNWTDKLFFKSEWIIYKITKCFAKNERKEFKKLKYIIGRTDWDKKVSRLIAPDSKYYVVNEILRDPFYQTVWKKSSNQKISLVTTMSNSLYKGLETVYRTARLLKKYNIPFSWTIIGQTKGSSYEKLVRRTTKIVPDDVNIIFTGQLSANDMIRELLDSDIFIQVSHIENSPNSLCEAMLLGMPIIASYVGGTSTLLKDEEDGLLYQDGEIYSLAGDILEFYHHQDFALSLAKHARQTALKRHDKTNIIKELLSSYYDMLS
jgi:glycosyltransferase involved in cell wall biosynthesis